MSPFGDFSTYISNDTMNSYQKTRPNHHYPDPKDIETANEKDLVKIREVLEKDSSQWHERTIGVDAKKIIAAIGMRKESPQQNTVMKCKAQTVGHC